MPKYAENANHVTCKIIEHQRMATDTWRLRVACPEIAMKMLPGQFIMIRLSQCNDPLIGRAFAMYDRYPDSQSGRAGIDIVYLVKGKFTQALSRSSVGDEVDLWGPLGNTFSDSQVDHLVLVAGGVGQTPMLTVGLEALGAEKYGLIDRNIGYAKTVTLCYGARSADRLAGVTDFQSAGFDVRIATEDGSIGKPQRVTDLLNEVIGEKQGSGSMRIACCGPEPMMAAVSKIAFEHKIPCEVSLETPMACGIGICFSCVAKVRQDDDQWDYQRTCVEGPIFEATSICW